MNDVEAICATAAGARDGDAVRAAARPARQTVMASVNAGPPLLDIESCAR
jgi:hypothetical protein